MAVEGRGHQVVGVNIFFIIFATLSNLLRCYVRGFVLKQPGTDDYWMLVAYISLMINIACCLLATVYGVGQHMTDVPPSDIVEALKWWYASQITYGTTMVLSKVSIACFLLRLTPNRTERWIIYVSSGITCAAGVTLTLLCMFRCSPVSYAWDTSQPGHCMSMDATIIITYCYSALAIITDFTFTILPIYMIWNLNMNKKTKMALVPIMAMACLASTAVIVRLPYVEGFRSPDFLYMTTDFVIWSQTEQGLAVAAGSLATLKPLFRIARAKLSTMRSSYATRSSSKRLAGDGYTPSAWSERSLSEAEHAGGSRKMGSSSAPHTGNSNVSATTDSKRRPRDVFNMSSFTQLDDEERGGNEYGDEQRLRGA